MFFIGGKNMQKLEYYYINRGTCAIIPIDKNVSEVIELDCSYVVNKASKEIIDDSCRYFGSSYQGRYDGSKKILNMNYKLPIMIEEFNNLIFFPTSSPRFGQCIWISLNNIKNYTKYESGSKIIFNSDKDLILNNSYYSLENQIFRAAMLDSLVRRRRKS
jgi:competence protein ComK